MNCKEFEHNLILHDSSEIGEKSLKHLEDCPACKKLYKEFSAMDISLNSMETIKMPLDLKMDIISAIPKQSTKLIQYVLDTLTLLLFSILFYTQMDLLIPFFSKVFFSFITLFTVTVFGIPLLIFFPVILGACFFAFLFIKQQI